VPAVEEYGVEPIPAELRTTRWRDLGRGAGDPRLLGSAAAELAVPRGRGDVLVRRPGARGRYAVQAVVQAMGGGKPPLVPMAPAVAAFHATLAVLGFDVMRWLLRVVLPISLVFVGVMVALYATTDNPRFDVGRAGVGLYYALPHSWLKIAWGLGAAAVTYIVCRRLLAPRYTVAPTVASSQRSSSPS
jgi:hypothetical protein